MRLRSSFEWTRAACIPILALAALCSSGRPVLAQPEPDAPPEELAAGDRAALSADAKRLWSEVQRLDKEGKLDEAIASGERCLAALRSSRGEAHADLVTVLGWLALRYERQEKLPQAQKARSEIYTQETRLDGPNHWKTI